jgi:hypothetical protein
MLERPLYRHSYQWARALFVLMGGLMVLILLKGLISGVSNLEFLVPMLLTPFVCLLVLWQAYRRIYRALLELPAASLKSEQKVIETLFLLAFLGAGGLLIGLTTGFVLGKSILH